MKALHESLKSLESRRSLNYTAFPRKLNLGCGFDHLQVYVNVDLNDFHNPNLVADIIEQNGFEVISIVTKDDWLFDCCAKKMRHMRNIPPDLQGRLLRIEDLGEFIRSFYIELLGRDADKDGYGYYHEKLENENPTRGQFLEVIYPSREYIIRRDNTAKCS